MSEKKQGSVVVVAPAGDGLSEALLKQTKDKPEAAAPPEPSVTHHTVHAGGRVLSYTATAGLMPLKADDGSARANLFYTAYVLDGARDLAQRPVTFAFNGGPGSSSVWLHLGVLGPRRVRMSGDATPKPPYPLIDNDQTLLDVSDLVFIDPVSTGLSRAAPGQDAGQFHGVRGDIESVAEFIRLWTTRNQRWASPKFLAGESYGTTRAAGLAEHLQSRHGMYLNGLMLISVALDFQTLLFERGNHLPYVLLLPTLTATAAYHGALPADAWPGLKDEVERFAIREYAPALMLGADLPEAERAHIRSQLARFTGLSEDFIERCDLKVSLLRFTKELLRAQRRTVGRLDSRFKGIDADAAGEVLEYDPSFTAIMGPYTAGLNRYLRGELGVEEDRIYEILTGDVRPWRFDDHENRYLNVSEHLRQAMTHNPHLKVLVSSGYYDMATPYFAADYTVAQLGLDPELRGNVRCTYYPAGHMMYVHEPSLRQLKQDLTRFIEDSQ